MHAVRSHFQYNAQVLADITSAYHLLNFIPLTSRISLIFYAIDDMAWHDIIYYTSAN